MKTIILFLAVLVIAFGFSCPLNARSAESAYLQSPDHPSTWVDGADNVHQALRWDESKQMLFADVKYSTVLYADDAHPAQVNDYALSFPAVKLDPSSNQLIAHGAVIGTVRPGLFGSHVVLNKGLDLDIHRQHGLIFAKIAPSLEN